MSAALRILSDVLAYRLRRLEMANLVAAVAIMLALHLSPFDVVVRTGFALLLNLLAYLTNDYFDVERDLVGGRDPAKTRFLAEHMKEALYCQLGLAVALAILAVVFRPGLLLAGVAGAGLCWAYSARLKLVPFADVASMTLWGVVMPLVAVPLDSGVGWLLLGQLGLFSTCFELIQVVRDRDEDAAAGIETTAVRLGVPRTLALARGAMLAAALYATLVLNVYAGPWLLLAAFLPFDASHVERYWTRVRLVFGIVWLVTLAWIWLTQATLGALVNASL